MDETGESSEVGGGNEVGEDSFESESYGAEFEGDNGSYDNMDSVEPLEDMSTKRDGGDYIADTSIDGDYDNLDNVSPLDDAPFGIGETTTGGIGDTAPEAAPADVSDQLSPGTPEATVGTVSEFGDVKPKVTSPQAPEFGDVKPKVTSPQAPEFGDVKPEVTSPQAPEFGDVKPEVTSPQTPEFGDVKPEVTSPQAPEFGDVKPEVTAPQAPEFGDVKPEIGGDKAPETGDVKSEVTVLQAPEFGDVKPEVTVPQASEFGDVKPEITVPQAPEVGKVKPEVGGDKAPETGDVKSEVMVSQVSEVDSVKSENGDDKAPETNNTKPENVGDKTTESNPKEGDGNPPEISDTKPEDGNNKTTESTPLVQHTFADYINPKNYDASGKYIGDDQSWGYKPYGMENSELSQKIDAEAREKYAEHLRRTPMPEEERARLYNEFVEKQSQTIDSKTISETKENEETEETEEAEETKEAEEEKETEETEEVKTPYDRQLEKTEKELQEAIEKTGEDAPRIKEILESTMESAKPRYETAKEVAERDPVLDNYTDHGPEHIKEVVTNELKFCDAYEQYAKQQGIEPGSDAAIKREVLVAAGVYHDTGMDGGLKNVEDYDQLQKEYEKENPGKLYGDAIRQNHSLESSMHVLEDAKQLEETGIDPYETAMLVYLHSKSNSGVRMRGEVADYNKDIEEIAADYEAKGISFDYSQFAEKSEKDGSLYVTDEAGFIRCEFERAVEREAAIAKERGLDFDPGFLGKMDENGKFTITNEAAYTRLQYEAAILREADAHRPIREISMTQSQDGIKMTQTGEGAKRISEEIDQYTFEFVDPATGEPTEREHKEGPSSVSQKCYLGESKVDCDGIDFNPENGMIEIKYHIHDAAKAPYCSRSSVKDRAAEAHMPETDSHIKHVICIEGASQKQINDNFFGTYFAQQVRGDVDIYYK